MSQFILCCDENSLCQNMRVTGLVCQNMRVTGLVCQNMRVTGLVCQNMRVTGLVFQNMRVTGLVCQNMRVTGLVCQNMRVTGLVRFYFIWIYRLKKNFLSNQGWNADNFVETILQSGRIDHGLGVRLKYSENTGRSIAFECTRNTGQQNGISSELSVYDEESKSGFLVKN